MHKVPFSKRNLDIPDVALHHTDVENSLRLYFGPNAASLNARFVGYSQSEVTAELNERLAELELASALTILSAVEAAFRIDYLQRCYQREKDAISRAFRNLHKRKRARAHLEEEILEIWKEHTSGAATLISELRAALNFRHWLAHGRYWEPKFGRKYDYLSIYTLAANVFANFPLFRP